MSQLIVHKIIFPACLEQHCKIIIMEKASEDLDPTWSFRAKEPNFPAYKYSSLSLSRFRNTWRDQYFQQN